MARKKKVDSGSKTPAWLVLFTSLSIILVAFFVMLNSFAVQDMDSVRDAIGSLRGSFGIVSGGFKPSKIDLGNVMISPVEIMNNVQTLDSFFESISDMFNSINVKRITVEKDGSTLKVTFPGVILFRPESAEIQDNAYPVLDKFITELKNVNNLISIEGHTDDTPIDTEEFPSNWDLSLKRAVRITEYFEKRGITTDRLRAIGHSMFKPLHNLVIDYGPSMNRRVEILVFFNPEEDDYYGIKKRRNKKGHFEVDADFL